MIGGVLVDLPVEGYSSEFCPSKGVLVVVLGPSLWGSLSTFLYPICTGWCTCPTVSGGLLPLRGSCCPASRSCSMRRQTPWFRQYDGCQQSLLANSFIVFKLRRFSDVLLMVPFKLCFLCRCGGRLHIWLRSSATRKTGDSYKDLDITSVLFQVCLFKMGCKLPVLLRMKIPVPLKKKIDIRIHWGIEMVGSFLLIYSVTS